MEKISVFSRLFRWLQSTEMFARPSKQLPGKWQLFEYYIDVKDDLLHFETEVLQENKQSLQIEMDDQHHFLIQSNLPVSMFQNIEKGEWSFSKNFLTFIHPENFRNNIEFQFAFEKGNLKLLQKDDFGKINFFGFFKPLV